MIWRLEQLRLEPNIEMIEGSLEVKLQRIRTDEKQRREESEKKVRKESQRREEKKKRQDAAHEPECSHVEHFWEAMPLNSLLVFSLLPPTMPMNCRQGICMHMHKGDVQSVECKV